MDKQIAKSENNNQPALRSLGEAGLVKSLNEEWRLMNEALERLGQANKRNTGGRLIVALDLTSSRADSLKQAQKATAAMFDAIKAVGSVAVKLIYYRGNHECKAGAWQDDASVVSRAMLGLSCKAGNTQIARVLKLALAERERVSGVVFIGDHSEDDADELLHLAATLGERSLPLFIFHEIVDHDDRALGARPVFERMAGVSGGVYAEFRPDSGAVLRELLSTVAAFSAAGHEGVKQVAQPVTAAARQLRGSLLMLPAPKDK
jgi:uncharacterized protein with GYD domain